jgi:hypothetical protein
MCYITGGIRVEFIALGAAQSSPKNPSHPVEWENIKQM